MYIYIHIHLYIYIDTYIAYATGYIHRYILTRIHIWRILVTGGGRERGEEIKSTAIVNYATDTRTNQKEKCWGWVGAGIQKCSPVQFLKPPSDYCPGGLLIQ